MFQILRKLYVVVFFLFIAIAFCTLYLPLHLEIVSGIKNVFISAPMVLNPHGIKPTLSKLDSRSTVTGFIPITTYICIKLDKERKNLRTKLVLCIQMIFKELF